MRGRKRNVATKVTEGKTGCHGRTTGKARDAKGAATHRPRDTTKLGSSEKWTKYDGEKITLKCSPLHYYILPSTQVQ